MKKCLQIQFSKIYREYREGKDMQNDNNDLRNIPIITRTAGVVMPPRWENEPEGPVTKPVPAKPIVSEPVIRPDGKELCKYLRSVRMEIAKANGIDYKTLECRYLGPCAGTCEKCDEEIRYLNKELEKIPESKRVYPTLGKYEPLGEKKKKSLFGRGKKV